MSEWIASTEFGLAEEVAKPGGQQPEREHRRRNAKKGRR